MFHSSFELCISRMYIRLCGTVQSHIARVWTKTHTQKERTDQEDLRTRWPTWHHTKSFLHGVVPRSPREPCFSVCLCPSPPPSLSLSIVCVCLCVRFFFFLIDTPYTEPVCSPNTDRHRHQNNPAPCTCSYRTSHTISCVSICVSFCFCIYMCASVCTKMYEYMYSKRLQWLLSHSETRATRALWIGWKTKNNAILATVKRLGLISRWGARQVL